MRAKKTRRLKIQKKEYKQYNNLHPLLKSVQKNIYEASTVKYDSSEVDVDGDRIIGVDVQGRFDGDSESVDVSELWEKWIYVFVKKMKISLRFL